MFYILTGKLDWVWSEIGRGAEAVVLKAGNIVVKKRIEKRYRHERLDKRIRKERTKKEARIMEKASKFVNVPKVLEVRDFEIVMEFVQGKKVRDVEMNKELAEKIGEVVGKLHSAGIAHNDLTTSNMILKNGELFVIDFGLADYGDVEDFATDLKVLRDSMRATHGDFWESIRRGYKKGMEKAEKVLERLRVVDSRGRYKVRGPQ